MVVLIEMPEDLIPVLQFKLLPHFFGNSRLAELEDRADRDDGGCTE